MKYTKALLIFVFALLSASGVYAQQTGEVTGTVTDPTGAVVANVTTTATNTATQQVRTAVSNGTGTYSIPYLLPGIYEIRAAGPGFKASVRTGIEIQVGGIVRIDPRCGQ